MSACGFYTRLILSFGRPVQKELRRWGIVVADVFTPFRHRFDEIIHPRFRVYTTLCPFYGQMNANFYDAGRTLTIKKVTPGADRPQSNVFL
jgi:hypothetical protein